MPATTTDAPIAQRVNLAEASPPGTGAVTRSGGQRYRMRIIEIKNVNGEAGIWGSCGHYPAAVLERDLPKIYGPGTRMFVDHPGIAESEDRPERSVRDLAARITSTPVREADGMYADLEVYPHMAPVIEALWPDIGVSIRAAGLVEHGEAQGRSGPIVSELSAGYSVDFVTAAGAGGKVTQLLESAREAAPAVELAESGSIGAWVESRLHLALTSIGDDMYGCGRLTRDERIALSSAVGDALDAFTTRLEADAPALYLRDQWGDPPTTPAGDEYAGQPETSVVEAGQPAREPTRLPVSASATGPAATPRRPDRAQLREAIRVAAVRDLKPSQIRRLSRAELARLAETSDPPPDPPAGTPPDPDPGAPNSDPGTAGTPPAETPDTTEEPVTDPAGVTPEEAGRTGQTDAPPAATTVTEAAATALAEARAETAQAKAGQAAAVRALAERDARDAARVAATAALSESPLPAPARQAVIERVTATAVLTEAGVLDEVVLAEAIQTQAAREATYLAALAEAGGAGTPSGLGASARPPAPEGSIADLDRQLNEAFRGIGLSEEAALVATKGR